MTILLTTTRSVVVVDLFGSLDLCVNGPVAREVTTAPKTKGAKRVWERMAFCVAESVRNGAKNVVVCVSARQIYGTEF